MNADRVTLYFVDRMGGTLRSKVADHAGDEPLKIRMPMGKGIAGRAALTGQVQIVDNAPSHPDFNPEVDGQTGYQTRTVLAVPVYNHRNEVFAVTQFLNRTDGQPFTPADAERFAPFSKALASSLEACYALVTRPEPEAAEATWIGARPIYRDATWIGQPTQGGGTSSGNSS
jgi:putative methionine-R-sulfoxide reductase with GAF domain